MLFRSIGIFFKDGDQVKCAGYGVWNNETLEITVWGNNPETEEKDGFDDLELFNIKLWDCLKGIEYPAVFTFRQGDLEYFTNDGLSYLTMLKPDIYDTLVINLSAGWNTISMNVLPDSLALDFLLSDILNLIVVVKDNSGNLFYPSFNLNTIGNWDVKQGYLLYILDDAELVIIGKKIIPENEIGRAHV